MLKKKILSVACTIMFGVSVFGIAGNTGKAAEADEEVICTATSSDAQAGSDIEEQLLIEDIRTAEEKVYISDIQIMDMGRYSIVGVDNERQSNVYYRWQAYDFSEGTWDLVHDWTNDTCVFWVPTHAGDYYLYVEAMHDGSVVSSYAKLRYFKGCTTSLKDISFECGSERCTYDIGYTTNDTELEFRWQAYDVSEGAWYTIRDWSSVSSGQWNPTHAGDYFLYVEAKGGDGKILTKLIVCHVDDAHITSFIQSATSGFINEDIVLAGKYSDATLRVGRQRYLVFDGTYWSELFTVDGQGVWRPVQEGQYLLCYEIYDKKGNRIEQSFKNFVVERPYVKLRDMKITHTYGLDYGVSLTTDTNDPAIQYRWQYYDIINDAWYMISDWSNQLSVTWIPHSEGYYWINMEARLRDGSIQSVTKGVVATGIWTEEGKMCGLANKYSSRTNYLLMVNCETHKVGVFYGSQGSWKLQYYWDCADGKASTPTVRGEFEVGAKGYYFDSDGSRCFYYTQFYNDYLFHSVLYNKDTGKLADGRVGMALSHGCVRLKIENAKWIYNNIPRGTKVVVYN